MNHNAATKPAVIIGLGNVLLGDDGFGSLTVETLKSEYDCDARVEIFDLGTPGLDLTPYLYDRKLAVIVDAVNAEGEAGTVCTYHADYLLCRARLRLTDHDVGLAESLAQLALADRAPGEVIVVGVVPESCEFGKGISRAVFTASSVAAKQISALLREHGFPCAKRLDPVKTNLWWLSERQDDAIAVVG